MYLSEIAVKLGCEMRADRDLEIFRVAGIDEAGPGDLTFVSNRKYLSHIKDTHASAIILGYDIPPVELPSLRSDNPYLAFARSLELFFEPQRPPQGIHPSAQVSADADVGDNPSIGAFAVVSAGCKLGANVTIYPHAVVYPNAVLGDDVVLHAHAVIRESCRLGNRVVIQNGAVVGSDGFGFAPQGNEGYYKIPQTGRVIVEDDVEIGANTTIDRAAVGDTIVRRGAKLDNLVQVGHGAVVGENSVLAAQVGLAGSTRLGRNVRAGGQVGFAGHLEVGDNAVVTAQSGTSHDVPPGAIVSGSPAFANSEWLRSVAAFPRIPALLQHVRRLEKEVERLKAQLASLERKYPT
jgi:UDP-3-O-[3-hydroxymyristoyl] glucosamine N-acyltransferase